MIPTGVDKWIDHTPMSDPGDHAANFAALPADIAELNRIVQSLFVHADWLVAYGLDANLSRAVSRDTLPVAQRLTRILKHDARPLQVSRSPDRREIGTCRDMALMLCSMLRGKGIAARPRCGFASYFNENWEDHWVCEYWDSSARMWRLSDPQLDEIQRAKCGVEFDTLDVPRRAFLHAGTAWLECRAGRADFNRFGQGPTTGPWFVKIDVIRDHYVVNNRETSVWDSWRTAPLPMRLVSERDAQMLDELAACPERPLVELTPEWLT
jgi:hypothetical protein